MNATWTYERRMNIEPLPSFRKKKKKEWQTINLLLLAWRKSFQNQVLLKCNNCISLSYKHTNNLHACAHTHTRTGPDEWSPDGSCRQRSDCCPPGMALTVTGSCPPDSDLSAPSILYHRPCVCVCAPTCMCTICKTWRHRVTFDLYPAGCEYFNDFIFGWC